MVLVAPASLIVLLQIAETLTDAMANVLPTPAALGIIAQAADAKHARQEPPKTAAEATTDVLLDKKFIMEHAVHPIVPTIIAKFPLGMAAEAAVRPIQVAAPLVSVAELPAVDQIKNAAASQAIAVLLSITQAILVPQPMAAVERSHLPVQALVMRQEIAELAIQAH